MQFSYRLATALGILAGTVASPAHADEADMAAIGSINGSIATFTAPDGSTLYEPGFGFQLHMPYFELGMQAELSEAEVVGGKRSATNYVPLIGAHLEHNSDQELILQAFLQARLPLQARSGANTDDRLGYALGADVGGRVWLCSGRNSEDNDFRGLCAGASLSVRYQQHLSDFQIGSAVMPAGSGTFSLPFMFSIGLNPRSMP